MPSKFHDMLKASRAKRGIPEPDPIVCVPPSVGPYGYPLQSHEEAAAEEMAEAKTNITEWIAGDEYKDTGATKTICGVTWRVLERLQDGKTRLAPTRQYMDARTALVKREWQEQQDAFRKLRQP